jgi:hypothetical protein
VSGFVIRLLFEVNRDERLNIKTVCGGHSMRTCMNGTVEESARRDEGNVSHTSDGSVIAATTASLTIAIGTWVFCYVLPRFSLKSKNMNDVKRKLPVDVVPELGDAILSVVVGSPSGFDCSDHCVWLSYLESAVRCILRSALIRSFLI